MRLPAPGAPYQQVTRAEIRLLSLSPARLPVPCALATALRGPAVRVAGQRQRRSAAGTDAELHVFARWQGMSGCDRIATVSTVACRASACATARLHPAAPARACLSTAHRRSSPHAPLWSDAMSVCSDAARSDCTWQPCDGCAQAAHRSAMRRRGLATTASAVSPRRADSPTATWTLSKERSALPLPRRPQPRAQMVPRRPVCTRAADGSAPTPDSGDGLGDEGDPEVNLQRRAHPLSCMSGQRLHIHAGDWLLLTCTKTASQLEVVFCVHGREMVESWPCPSQPVLRWHDHPIAALFVLVHAGRILPIAVLAAQVSRELEEFDVQRFRRAGAHLDLMWNVAKVRDAAERSFACRAHCPGRSFYYAVRRCEGSSTT